ncbi:unnamed protein product [Orchesella dallaii]|uniref:Uncharacterized protein n=1 Tax=Orchesella dallaii TaxID=48710 RepID=A0ABP1R8Z3_9HEXA
MRKVSRRMKVAVDRFLYSHQPAWLSKSFTLKKLNEIEEFVKYARDSVDNSFIAKYLKITCRDRIDEAMTLLQLKGREIVEFNLELCHTDDAMILNRHLIQALKLIPNVESLCLKWESRRPRWVLNENIDWERMEGQPDTSLPPLSALTKLIITIDGEDGLSPEGFMRHVVQAYGAQLTFFSCSTNCIGIDLEIGLQTCNLMSNLRHLELIGCFEEMDVDESLPLSLLSQVKWPNLESLRLDGSERDYGCYCTEITFVTLNFFRSSLQELKLVCNDGFDLIEELFDDTFIHEFPKMKSLVLIYRELRCCVWVWLVFRLQFTNLEHLCFLSERNTRALPIPNATERRAMFARFPRLKTLTWMNQRNNTFKKTVFTRPLSLGQI